MIHDPQHTIQALAVHLPAGLTLTFADGAKLAVDLEPTIKGHAALAALGDEALFARAMEHRQHRQHREATRRNQHETPREV